MKQFKAFVLCVCLVFLFPHASLGATLGPVTEYAELVELSALAQEGDILLIAGELSAAGAPPLSTQASLRITSSDEGRASLSALQLGNASVVFTDIDLYDSLSITGTCHVELGRGVHVQGAPGKSAVFFDGNGTLILDPGCTVTGMDGGEGITISHHGGEFYGGIECTVQGGSGITGGCGMTVSPLTDSGTLMISGTIQGGNGTTIGGQALNLYDLSDNAFVTVTGTLRGGQGAIGGDGIQLVSASGNASIGIAGQVAGGQGESFGGDALILMNLVGASSVSLAGSLTGGDVLGSNAQPGLSLLVVGDTSSSRMRMGDCILQDGRDLFSPDPTPEPALPEVTPLPEITSSVEDPDALLTPAPVEEAPDEAPIPAQEPIPDQTPEPVPPEQDPAPSDEPIQSQTPDEAI